MIIRNHAAWLTTDEAVDYVKLQNPDGSILLRRAPSLGIMLTAEGDGGFLSIGINAADLVKLGRYLLAVALAEGQNINEGFRPGGVGGS